MMDVDLDLDRRTSPESVDRSEGSDRANTTINAVASTAPNPGGKTPHSANTASGSASRRSHSTPGSGAYNCLACYQRKTKCDRRLDGCSNCSKAGVTCTYPPQRNAAPQKRGPYNKAVVKKNEELEQKILALEATVQDLNKKMQDRSRELSVELQGTSISTNRPGQGIPTPVEDVIFANDLPPSKSGSRDNGSGDFSTRASSSTSLAGEMTLPSVSWFDFVNKFDDRSRDAEGHYDLRRDDSSSSTSHDDGFWMASDPSCRSKLHPDSQTIYEYWTIFKERVDPLLKIIHIPSFEKYLFGCKAIPDDSIIGMDALMFSIYYAAIVNCPPAQHHRFATGGRDEKLRRYGCAIKRILAEPDVLTSSDIMPLQALTIYLYHSQSYEDQSEYLLIGTALRMAQGLGLHRCGQSSKMSPFEIEMRRRLWWNIYRLERRIAENYVSNPFAIEPHFDTLPPSNVNDSDISPEDKSFPVSRTGRTEMTFCLTDFAISSLTFSVLKQLPSLGSAPHERKTSMIRDALKKLTEEHLQFCNPANEFDFMIITHAKLSLSRIWLLAHQPSRQCLERLLTEFPFDSRRNNAPIRNLLPHALEAYEYAQILPDEPRTSKWSWFWCIPNNIYRNLEFYLLAEMCYRPSDSLVQRAQAALEEGATRLRASNSNGTAADLAKYSTGPFETTLNKLRGRVTELRSKAGSDTSSMQSSPVISRRQALDSAPITPNGSYSHPWTTAGRDSGFPFPRTSRPSISEPLMLPSGPPKYPTFPSMELPRPDDISNASASLGLEGSAPGLQQMVTTPGLTFANLVSGPLSPGNLTSDLHDMYMSKTPWFQFQDETMGIGVEEFTDGSWEDIFRGLPVFK